MNIIECAKIRLEEANHSTLPAMVKKDLLKLGKNFVTVYTKKSKTLRFFPIRDEPVWWLKISISGFSPEISGAILARLNKLISEFIFSTGVCISTTECFWDGVIIDSSFKKKKDECVRELESIPNVTKVTIIEIV